MNKTSKKSSFDASLVAPGLVLAMIYLVFVSIRGLPGSAELTAKRRVLLDAQMAAVPPGEVQRLTAESADLAKKTEEKRAELETTRKSGESLARKQSKPLGRIDVVTQIEEILKRRGLEVTKVKAAETTNSKMAASLQRAAASLVSALAKSRPAPLGPAAPISNIEMEARLEAQAEAQRVGMDPGAFTGGGVANAPPLDLREMEIRGEYHDMLSALWDLTTGAGESVVVSLGLERPARAGKVRDPLIWRLIVHVQPGSGPSTSSPMSPIPIPRPPKPERLAVD